VVLWWALGWVLEPRVQSKGVSGGIIGGLWDPGDPTSCGVYGEFGVGTV
jgi:hypothetical protein